MKRKLDLDGIAEKLGAERRGKVRVSGGYFGAMQLAAEVAQRFSVPPGGGRATDPAWSERRLIPLSPKTLQRLEEMADALHVAPLQIAAILLEKSVSRIGEQEISELRESAPPYGSRSGERGS